MRRKRLIPVRQEITSKESPNNFKRCLRWVGWLGVCALLISTSFIASLYLYLNPKLPEAESYRNYRLERPMRVLSNDGALISEFGTRRLIPTGLEDVPQQYIDAVIATEDKRFYSHHGIDWISLANDTIDFFVNPSVLRGASTITMQLPRNVADLSREQTIVRKAKEMLLAIKIEQELTKEEILELYINVIPFGKHSYGLKAAAYTYYDRPPDQLNLAQLAMLAGIPKRPEACNPINGPICSLERRNLVLRRMRSEDLITQTEYAEAIAEPITARVYRRELDLNAPYPSERVRRELVSRYGNQIYSGFVVETTIDSRHQAAAQDALRKELESYDKRYGYRGPEGELVGESSEFVDMLVDYSNVEDLLVGAVSKVDAQAIKVILKDGEEINIDWEGLRWARAYLGLDAVGRRPRSADEIVAVGDVVRVKQNEQGVWQLSQVPKVTGALVAIRPDTGAITAMVGGYSFFGNQFNRAEQAKRQPGSGIKPFIYSAALHTGEITPATIFNDAPLVFPDEGLETFYRPRNEGGTFRGPTRLREALYRSINLVSMRVFMSVGADSVIEYLQRFGFREEQLPKSTQLALGGGTLTVTPLEMATAYSVFANGGYEIEPHLVTRVFDFNNTIIFEPEYPEVCVACEIKSTESEGVDEPDSDEFALERSVESVSDLEENLAQPLVHETELDPEPDVRTAKLNAKRVIEERNAFLMNSMLRDVVNRGTGRRALQLNRSDLAGKTGTTDEATDTWFNGFHPSLATSVWVGFDSVESLGQLEFGSTRPLSIWIDFMRTALHETPNTPLTQPENVVRVRIDPETSKQARGDLDDAIWEYFRVENSPVQKTLSTRPSTNEAIKPEDIF